MSMEPEKPKNDWREEIEVTSNELVDRVKQIIKEGNVRRLIIRSSDDRVLLDLPLSAGAFLGGIMAFLAPVWATLAGIAALVTRVRIEIVRDEPVEEETPPAKEQGSTGTKKRRIEIKSEDD